ncbi:External alternative NAD(P)H-ubiquinone oxidoreductase B1, mitochondrial [Morella rubra]|uniref:NADH:ubiquinone reductase (non-electrogenic) n=1 Tax=Morella rubra TaxID=262757 RepID=A0A6A1VBR3_9ROSI|nr:External alternative NAD(P)H-ubiquinone oxidoreductase B1, mitochondrial [Morella rubra]
MTILSFLSGASRTLKGYPGYSKLLVLCTLSGGGLVAYSESQPDGGTPGVDPNQNVPKKKRVLVLGTGWAGTSFVKDLDASLYDVQIVSPRNYFAFTPLLPSVTCGTVEARSVVEPIRNIVKKRRGEMQFCEAECVKIDAANKKVLCRSNLDNSLAGSREFSLEYDYLVIAIGAEVNTFNTPGVMENCHFLKEVEDAQKIRTSVIDCFEKAVLPGLSEEERRINLHFVIVGGGPTGVEFAAELHDFFEEDLVKLYPTVKDLVKITVIQSGDHILNTFDERISSFAEQKFKRDGIEVQTGCRVVSVSDKEITMKMQSKGEVCSTPHGLVVWSTGVKTRPVVRDFMEQIGQNCLQWALTYKQVNRRVLATDEWLRVKGCDDVFAIGDCTSIDQRKIKEDISSIFKAADKDNSGTLTVEEFQDVIDDILIRYPQLELYLKSQHLSDVADLLKDPQGNKMKNVDIEGFKLALSQVDSQMKSLPATAQVAAQQGAYLSRCFNIWSQCEENPEGPRRFRGSGRHQFRPFRYKHFGQFAPLGGEQAAAELPGDWVSAGHSTQWLWYSVYASLFYSGRFYPVNHESVRLDEEYMHKQHGFSTTGGGLVAFSDARPFKSIYSDPVQGECKRKKVVVLGTGWAGTSFLKNLKNPSYDVHVVSPRNYFAFTPLLPSVTCGTVEARSIVEPIRCITRKKSYDVHFKEAKCYKIDPANKKVYCKSSQDTELGEKEEFALDYDYLVIAMGARANTFNTPGVLEYAHFLKEVEDAQRIRQSVIDSFERASLPSLSEEEKKRILHFVVVGGGPAGVEFAAELHDFVHEDLGNLYPQIKDYVKITLIEAADHILNMFDKRITAFAEEKFQRDGIHVKTGSMVVKVSDKEISTKERATGEVENIPYGMVVWATGIGTRPEIIDFMKQIGQTNRRALATDEWLRVEGSDSIYALGDCATINQRSVMEDIAIIFSKADNNKSGTLTLKDFQEVVDDILERYPQVKLHLKRKKMRNFAALLIDSQENAHNQTIEIENFKSALSEVDSQMKNLPATAQVAAQQGDYLADCFNRMEECEKYPEGPLRFRGSGRHRFHPFRYKHFGQFAPLGGEQTAAQLPGDWVSIGHSTQWLWYSVYASKLVSWRTRMLVVSDWGRRFIFGRDSSRI